MFVGPFTIWELPMRPSWPSFEISELQIFLRKKLSYLCAPPSLEILSNTQIQYGAQDIFQIF